MLGIILEFYINDIIIKSDSTDNQLADLRLAFERMRWYGFKMNGI
jgi:hypothetical protein